MCLARSLAPGSTGQKQLPAQRHSKVPARSLVWRRGPASTTSCPLPGSLKWPVRMRTRMRHLGHPEGQQWPSQGTEQEASCPAGTPGHHFWVWGLPSRKKPSLGSPKPAPFVNEKRLAHSNTVTWQQTPPTGRCKAVPMVVCIMSEEEEGGPGLSAELRPLALAPGVRGEGLSKCSYYVTSAAMVVSQSPEPTPTFLYLVAVASGFTWHSRPSHFKTSLFP